MTLPELEGAVILRRMTLREFRGVLLLSGGGSCGRSGQRRGRGWTRRVEIAEVVGRAERGCWVGRCVKRCRCWFGRCVKRCRCWVGRFVKRGGCWRKVGEEGGRRDSLWAGRIVARWSWTEWAERWLGVGLAGVWIVAALRWRVVAGTESRIVWEQEGSGSRSWC